MKKIYLLTWCLFCCCQLFSQFSESIDILPVTSSYYPEHVFVEDMDFDGDNDIVTIITQPDMFSTGIEYFENSGDGTFANWTVSCWSFEYFMEEVLVGGARFFDVDNDGFKDLLVKNYDGIIWMDIRLPECGNENLLFMSGNFDVPYSSDGIPLTMLDFDLDGDVDILGSFYDSNLEMSTTVWIENDGNWNFTDTTQVTGNAEFLSEDVDMDGDLDQVGSMWSYVSLIENIGNSEFVNHSFPVNFSWYRSGDLDEDSDLDLVGFSSGMVGWYEQTSPFIFDIWHPIFSPPVNYAQCVVGDIDSDGDQDIHLDYGQNYDFESHFFVNDGFGSFNEASNEIIGPWWTLVNSVLDFDNDGVNEVVAYRAPYALFDNAGADLMVIEGITNSNSGTATVLSQFFYRLNESEAVDLDLDGDYDLLAIIEESEWYGDSLTFKTIRLMNDGSENFSEPVLSQQSQTTDWGECYLLQLDNSGIPALLIVTSTNNLLHVSLQNYDEVMSNFVEVQSFDLLQNIIVYGENQIYATDLNNDGYKDIILPSGSLTDPLSAGYFLLNDASGVFTSVNVIMPEPFIIRNMLDADLDGDLDFVCESTGEYVVLENAGDLSLATASSIATLPLLPAGAIDKDNDTDVDFFCKLPASHRYIWMERQNDNSFLVGSFLQNQLEFTVEHLRMSADFNNDDSMDFLFTLQGGDAGFLDLLSSGDEINSTDRFFEYGETEVVDLDNDGFKDIIFTSDSGNDYDTHVSWIRNEMGDGCNDPLACNYNASDLNSDACCYGNCGCTDVDACNFSPSAICDDGSCLISGCTQSAACNFEPSSNCDNGSCIYGNAISISVTANNFNNQTEVGYLRFFEGTDVQNITHELSMVDGLTIPFDLSCISSGCYGFGFYIFNSFPNDASITVVIADADGVELVNTEYVLAEITLLFDPANDFQYLGPMIGPVFPVGSFCLCGENALTGCTDPLAVNFSELAQCSNSSCLYGISGKVFNDLNADGIMQIDDYGLPFEEVTIQPGGYTLITDNNGNFFMPLEFGTYSVTHTHNPLFQFDTTPVTNYVIVDGVASQAPQLFGISTTVPINTICIDIYPDWYICNAFVNFNMCFRNMGNVPIDGVLRLEKDPLYSAYQEITPIDSIVGNYFYFSYENLMPGEMFFYDIELFTPTTDVMGTILTNTVLVNGFYNDVQVAMGAREREIEHACSYDPNDKQPYPIGYTESHFIENDTEVEYVIRFQNTGTAPALNVIVRDTLDTNVDLSTFRLVANTHNVMTSLDSTTREVVFYMLDILLPDSVHDEPGSHGLVSYRIMPLSSLVAGDQFENTAYIYFDNNDPVITNTTDHTIFDCNAYLAEFGISESGTCYAQELTSTPDVLWTEGYTWELDGAYFTNTEIAQIDVPGDHELTLTISNPLCGLRSIEQNISIENPIVAEIIYSNTTLCNSETILLESSFDSGNHWFFEGNEIATTIDLVVNSPGTYELLVEQNGCELLPVNVLVIEGELPSLSAIAQFENTLSVENIPGLNYQWFFNNESITDATSSSIEISQSGLYTLIATGEFDCDYTESVQAIYNKIESIKNADFSMFPNPATSTLNINLKNASVDDEIHIINAEGRLIFNQRITRKELKITVCAWPAGLYYVSLLHEGQSVFHDKIIIE